MFTGIVQATGHVTACEQGEDSARVRIHAGLLDLHDVTVGDSVAVAGCCLTVVQVEPPLLDFDISCETLRCTVGFDVDRAVNLEKALRLSDRLGGHLVSGHVDGIGVVTAFESDVPESGANRRLEVEVPFDLARYMAPKGSIAVEGVSLTTNAVSGARFTVNLIPHTLAVTTLGNLHAGAKVNLEVDMIARYVERLRSAE